MIYENVPPPKRTPPLPPRKVKQIIIFRDTNHHQLSKTVNTFIKDNNIDVEEIEFRYPFVKVIYKEAR